MSGDMAMATLPNIDDFLARTAQSVREGDWESVRDESDAYLNDQSGSPEALFVFALAAFHENDFRTAFSYAEEAFEADSQVKEYAEFLALLCLLTGDFNKSVYYGKMTGVLKPSERIGAVVPKDMAKFADEFLQVEENPLLQRAFKAVAVNDWLEAEHWFRQQISFDSTDKVAYQGLVNCLFVAGRFRESVQTLRAARHVLPSDPEISSMLGTALTHIGEYEEGKACHRWAIRLGGDNPLIHANAITDILGDPRQPASEISSAFRAWGQRFGEEYSKAPSANANKDRLIIGYFIGSLGKSLMGSGIAKILSFRNSQRFSSVGFGFGNLSDPRNFPFQKAMDTWHNIQGMDMITVGSMVAAERVDILVDLSGFKTPAQLVAFGQRLAPIQLSWSASAYGTGLANMDGLLTDDYLDADGAENRLYSEAPVFLKHGGLVIDLPAIEAAAGNDDDPLDETGEGELTFAADVALTELDAETVETWARILLQAEGSKLVLVDHDFSNEGNAERLIGLFGNFGMAHRVDVISGTDFQEFYRQADICLLPKVAARTETFVEPLVAGLPVICFAGEARHTRLVGSMMHHLGLEEDMVATSLDDYVKYALGWAGDEGKRKAHRDTIRDRLDSAAFFNPAERAADLEAAYEKLWKEYFEEGDG